MSTRHPVAARSAVIAAGVVGLAIAVPRVVRRRDDRRASSSELTGPAPVLEHHTVTSSDGTLIHVAELGAGPPLVLIHGLSLTHDLWRYQFIDLADRFRVIAYDLRGHGKSTIGTDGIGPHQSAADLLAVLEQLDIDGAVVAGHSIGGTVLGQFCADHPRRGPTTHRRTRVRRHVRLGNRRRGTVPGDLQPRTRPDLRTSRRPPKARPHRNGDGVSRSALTVRATAERRACPLHARTRRPDRAVGRVAGRDREPRLRRPRRARRYRRAGPRDPRISRPAVDSTLDRTTPTRARPANRRDHPGSRAPPHARSPHRVR